ncbi:MAG TPA: hypothetical protein VN281_17295 [Verrucomicrobiae bacterium]|jgi:hypothetical protein|nr:hypothetical protein [Verrucomicrobiae bacterium]
MSARPDTSSDSVDFIRLLFTSRVQEEIAYRWASRLSKVLGARVASLRPETTLAELLDWASWSGSSSVQFTLVFEPELRMDLAPFLDHAEHTTFREMVEHYAARFSGCT